MFAAGFLFTRRFLGFDFLGFRRVGGAWIYSMHSRQRIAGDRLSLRLFSRMALPGGFYRAPRFVFSGTLHGAFCL